MSQEELHQEPRVAYCEDGYEDEDEVATPLANVAVKRAGSVTKRASYERRRNDGSDSGYSSKTNTNTSSSSRRDMADLKIDTTTERQRQPYSFIQRPETLRRSSSQSRQEVVQLSKTKPKYYVHKPDDRCYVCDTYGEHLPEELRPSREPVAPSPKASKKVPEQIIRREDPPPRPLRRESSVRNSRPQSMYAPAPPQFNYPTQAPNVMQYAPMSPAGWSTPLTPTMGYSPFSYTPAVMTTALIAEPSYFENAPRENRPSRSNNRASMHGDVIIRQSKAESRPMEPQRTSSSRDHVRSGPDRTVRAAEYDGMPPPARPTVTLAHRPSIKKSATYNTPFTSTSNRRASLVIDDDEAYVSNTAPSPSRDRRAEPSLPPSSYRGPTDFDRRPPNNRKSVSYDTPSATTKVSSSTLPPKQTSNPRRSTTTGTETRKLADAEEYQAQRRSLTSNDLTVEALQSLKQHKSSTRSETSSHRSHHTKSSSSAGGKSKRSNSEIKMIINGATVLIDTKAAMEQSISISTHKDGAVGISLSGRGEEDRSRAGSQKRIEKAPSATSRTSRVSTKSVGSKDKEKERERERDRERERILEGYAQARRGSSTASRSRSRAPDMRRSYDHGANSPNPWGD